MDKETLSHYGWIVILVLILAVLLALASPFGNFIAEGFKATYVGFFQTGENALGIIIPGSETKEDEEQGDAYALILDNTSNANEPYPMIFVRTEKEVKIGDSFNSKTYGEKVVLAVYTGFETETYNAEYMDDWLAGSDVPWREKSRDVTCVVFESKISPVSTSMWFAWFENCDDFNMQKLDTSNVINMSHMFYDSGITDASSLNVSNNVTTIESIFENCSNLTVAPILKNANNLINLKKAFYWSDIRIAPELPQNVENLYFTFAYCKNLTKASDIISNKTISIDGIYTNCESLVGEMTIIADVPGVGVSNIYGSFYSVGSKGSFTIKSNDISILGWIKAGSYGNVDAIITLDGGTDYVESNYTSYQGLNDQNSGTSTILYISEGIKTVQLAAFRFCQGLEEVYLPSTLKSIEGSAFLYFGGDFYYEGTIAEWNEIETGSLWCGPYSNLSYLNNANQSYVCATVHCSDGDVLIYPKDLR